MNIGDLIAELFCKIDDALPDASHHSPAILSLSELVTIGVLQAMKNVSQRAFYHWLKDNYGHLFPRLPHRTRLNRRLRVQQHWTGTSWPNPPCWAWLTAMALHWVIRCGKSLPLA